MSEALERFISLVSSNPTIREADKHSLINMAREIGLQCWQGGVQHGYMKMIQDHRDGHINVAATPHAKLTEAAKLASDGRLAPSTFFKE